MPQPIISPPGQSDYNQASFIGGINLLSDDTRLQPNQIRALFNARNRYDQLDLVLSSQLDEYAPKGVKQEMVTFGDYLILFVEGKAYYKLYTNSVWTEINGFAMSTTAPRYWTEVIPVTLTNYLRIAATTTIGSGPGQNFSSSSGPISLNNIAGTAAGNIPGLLVQDGVTQPQFIFLNTYGIPTTRTTQTFEQWSITFTDPTNTVVAQNGDKREYVPIGTAMAFVDGVLYIVDPSGNYILRSVSGRPLDFVINVPNTLATNAPYTMTGGGDAYTTAYSVGVGGITCLRALSDGSLFVAAGNANFSVSKNTTPSARTEFGEYTFIRKFLFNANCLSDRCIIDSLGDTRFIDLTGVRSFNAIEQLQNEGRNSPFTATIAPVFNKIIQDDQYAASILYDNYELYGVSTVFGPVIAVYDTINQCWVGFDEAQTNGKRIKKFCKIEIAQQALFAITEDDQLYRLYVGPNFDTGSVRIAGVCANLMYGNQNIKMANPKNEIKVSRVRVVVNNITADSTVTFTPYCNNRISSDKQTKTTKYVPPITPSNDPNKLPDVDTMLANHLFSFPDNLQGWKMFGVLTWNNGSITQISVEAVDQTPQNPLNSQ